MKFLLFAGSLRKESLNKKLLAVAREIVTQISPHEAKVVDLQQLAFPVYDGDIESQGIPLSVKQLGSLVDEVNGLIISTPEYNGSISSPLKNAVDWLSRLRPVPLERKPVLLLGASPGYFGAIRGLLHSRRPFEVLGCFVYPQTFALPKADKAFRSDGALESASNRENLEQLVKSFIGFTQSLSGF